MLSLLWSLSSPALGANNPPTQLQGIHTTPVILSAYAHYSFAGFPLESFRLIRNYKGVAQVIPFQIDEKNLYEDFVMEHHLGSEKEEFPAQGNGLFDGNDELSFMGSDTGSTAIPTTWNFAKPSYLFRVDAFPGAKEEEKGSVFVAIYIDPKTRPPLSQRRYVHFDIKKSKIETSHFHYAFDPNNYLTIREVELITHDKTPKKLIQSSSFYLKADLKYFLTIRVGHQDITSELKAYKIGPIRVLVKVAFLYTFLKLNFEMGMYTEVSFFSNMVTLPTIMHNPLEGRKNLNQGSGFYYGFGMPYDLALLGVETNMQSYKKSRSLFKSRPPVASLYHLSLGDQEFLMQVSIKPSKQMRKKGQSLLHYLETGNPLPIMQRDWERPLPLGEAPVNLGVYLELSDFSEGEHVIDFNLIFENDTSEAIKSSLKNLPNWRYRSSNVPKTSWNPTPSSKDTAPKSSSKSAPEKKADDQIPVK